MPDEPDPPRKFYGLRTREDFERANAQSTQPSTEPTNVRELLKSAGGPRLAGVNSPANRPNEVHAILQQNLERDHAGSWYDVSLRPNLKRRRRIWAFWLALIAVDVPLGFLAWKLAAHVRHDQGAAIIFVFAIAGVAMFTAVVVWQTWFLRTES
ncbi:MAG: hypothetical protein ABIZ81_04000 [Opitutaceae bacterium]